MNEPRLLIGPGFLNLARASRIGFLSLALVVACGDDATTGGGGAGAGDNDGGSGAGKDGGGGSTNTAGAPQGGNGGEPQGGQPQGGGGGVADGGGPLGGGGGVADGGGGSVADGGGGGDGGSGGEGGMGPDPLANGQPCDADADCVGGLCLLEEDFGYAGGMCSEDCTADGTCTETGSECADFGATDGCLVLCDPKDADPCGDPDLTCLPGNGFSEPGVCLALCEGAGDCTAAGNVCNDTPTGFCAPPEICGNGADEDFDGEIDCDDVTCVAEAACTTACAGATVAMASNDGNTSTGTDIFEGTCSSTSGGGNEVLYRYTQGNTAGTIDIALASATDQGFSVRTTCNDQATELVCRDSAGAGGVESATVALAANQSVFIMVEAYNDASNGPFTLTVAPTPVGGCSDIAVAGATNTGNTTTEADLLDGECAAGTGGEQVYSYMAPALGNYEFRLQNTTDHALSFRTTCNDASSEVACVDGAVTSDEVHLRSMAAGETIFVVVEGYSATTEGAYTLNIAPGPVGGCAAALVAGASNPGNTATLNDVVDADCSLGSGGEQVYAYTATVTGDVEFRLQNATDHVMAFRTDCNDLDSEVDCVDSATTGDEVEVLSMTAGETVFVVVEAYSGTSEGTYTLVVTPQ